MATELHSPLEIGERLLRAKACAQMCGCGQSTWWKWLSDGITPQPVRIGQRFTAWKRSDVEAFIRRVVAGEFEAGV